MGILCTTVCAAVTRRSRSTIQARRLALSDSEKIRPRSALLLKDAKVLDYLPVDMDAEPAPRVESVDLRIEDGRIVER